MCGLGCSDGFGELVKRQSGCEEVPLCVVAAELQEEVSLRRGFNGFGDAADAMALCEVHYRRHDGSVRVVRGQVSDE